MHFRCIKSGKKFDFCLNMFNNPEQNSFYYSNLVLEGGYRVDGYQSLVPFKKVSISYSAKDTPCYEKPELASMLGLGTVRIKDESYNPYGTHKDRRSEYIVNVAIEQQVDKIVCLTAGNAGYSLSRYCSKAGIDYTSLVFPWVSQQRLRDLSDRGHTLIIDGNRKGGILRYRCFKEIVEEYDLYERQKKRNNIWSVTNGFEPISINAYKEIFYEIKHLNPDYIVLPCGSGDTIIGIRLAIKEFSMTTKIIACGPKNEHPLKFALLFGEEEIKINDYKEESIAEKLTTSFTGSLPILYKIFSEEGNVYCETDNQEITQMKNILTTMGIKVENSAVPAFSGLAGKQRPDISSEARVVIVSTGRGIET